MNLAHLLDPHPDADVAIISRNRSTTYGELRDQIGRLRGGLADLGVDKGDRVAIVCGNNRHFVISYLATIGLGAVAVPLNPSSPSPELQHEIAVVEPVADHHRADGRRGLGRGEPHRRSLGRARHRHRR